MATKAIYTKVDNTYYRVNQETINPSTVIRMPRTHSQMNTDEGSKAVNTSIWINSLDSDNITSNKEDYDAMVRHLVENKVLDIPTIENNYVLYCDYSVFDENGVEINHNAFKKHIKPKDAIYILGVNQISELVYKQVKVFKSDIALNVRNEYPMGIMHDTSRVRYTMHINDIAIFQDLVYDESDVHNSIDKISHTMRSSLETMTKIYSTYQNGITIAAVEIPFIPRKIVLDINLALDNLIVVYDNENIKNIIRKNVEDEMFEGEDSDDSEGENEDETLIIYLNGGNADTVYE